ncbi:exodeoxyribonuclease III [Polymorphum gilvum]|uniref:Exodeoxyribonuclease III n=1 Tax=Polymorphum gilvum (strain LMG 25793 / CGMCC 1.9160 / SL003B-26A1) TaxID=991905 RepID=F2J0T8_POLGS|nr:exodeoxyribonuclease III [Polymorphum gilvum]ADZ70774.1 Exodeoxyribonuclease III [Polymorphum gilvum SL003B-26A1]
MKIATWNINGVKARIDTVLAWLQEARPDVACLQEIKSVDEAFPCQPFEDLGYNVATHGQKGFNGVALLSKRPLEDVRRGLPGDDGDEQARYIEACVSTDRGAVRVGCLYLPNGNPLGTDKFPYKLAWMDRLRRHAALRLAEEQPFLLLGDYNVIPEPKDARNPQDWLGDALFQPESRQHFRALVNLGFTEAVRACTDAADTYTFWDYQAGAWQKNNGIRIDHVLLSPQAGDLLASCGIDKHVRAWEKPSDHVPVWVELAA